MHEIKGNATAWTTNWRVLKSVVEIKHVRFPLWSKQVCTFLNSDTKWTSAPWKQLFFYTPSLRICQHSFNTYWTETLWWRAAVHKIKKFLPDFSTHDKSEQELSLTANFRVTFRFNEKKQKQKQKTNVKIFWDRPTKLSVSEMTPV